MCHSRHGCPSPEWQLVGLSFAQWQLGGNNDTINETEPHFLRLASMMTWRADQRYGLVHAGGWVTAGIYTRQQSTGGESGCLKGLVAVVHIIPLFSGSSFEDFVGQVLDSV
jgi:hypothetical protein